MSSKASSKKLPAETEPDPVFSAEQLEEFKEAFGVFDKDGDGRINPQEMCGLLNATGFSVSQSEVSDYCARIDQTGENLFDHDEYLKVAEYFNKNLNTADIINACVRVFFGENIKMSVDELKNILTTLGNPLTPEEVKHLMFNINPDGDDTIEIQGFVNKIAGIPDADDDDD